MRPLSPSKSRTRGTRRLLSLDGPRELASNVTFDGVYCGCNQNCVDKTAASITECSNCVNHAPHEYLVMNKAAGYTSTPVYNGDCCVPFTFVLKHVSGCTWRTDITNQACGDYEDQQWTLEIASDYVTLTFDFGEFDPGSKIIYRRRRNEWSCLCDNIMRLVRDQQRPPRSATGCDTPPCAVCVRPNDFLVDIPCCPYYDFPRQIMFTNDSSCSYLAGEGTATYNSALKHWVGQYQGSGPNPFEVHIWLCNFGPPGAQISRIEMWEIVTPDPDWCPGGTWQPIGMDGAASLRFTTVPVQTCPETEPWVMISNPVTNVFGADVVNQDHCGSLLYATCAGSPYTVQDWTISAAS